MLRRGTIIKWNDEKAYGFIAPDDGGTDIFLHLRALVDQERRPQLGDRVSYEVGITNGKGPRAERVTVRPGSASASPKPASASRRRPDRFSQRSPDPRSAGAMAVIFVLLLPAIVLAALWLAATRGFIPPWVAFLYLGMSAATALAYAVDKFRAQRARWRISESTLHLMEFAGGWPGALTAQHLLRHKTRKLSFQVTYWVIVLAHLAFWSWFTATQCGWLPR